MTALALALALAAGGVDPAAPFEEANARYLAGDFEGAARAYEALVAAGLDGPALRVNLGAARLRAGRRGAAIASFERALRLDPRDEDARADLALARAANADRLLGAPEPPFLARVVERTPDSWAALAFGIPWLSLWLLLVLRRAAGSRRRAALGLGAAAAALGALLGGALVLARAAERRADVAVVTAAESAVRAGPEAALRPTLRLHEGTRVRLLEERGGVVRVRLANGVEGWMAAAELERL